MSNNGIVTIHGKEYMTVAQRIKLAHEGNALTSVHTDVLSHDPVVIKATVTLGDREFTGISSVSLGSAKSIEKQNPYEVAETSAVGRALGFAGYGIIESVASADEVANAVAHQERESAEETEMNEEEILCPKHDVAMYSATSKAGKPYTAHKDSDGAICFGRGYLERSA